MNRSHFEKYDSYINPANQQSFDDGHLGGCNISGDPGLELPKMWAFLIDKFNIKSVIDVGCGFGYHVKTFKDLFDLEVLGIEGSNKVVELSLAPELISCHDYTTGKFIPDKTYDMCWSVEFVEHVDSLFVNNFIETFKRCRVLVMTHGVPGQGGHHHVNEQPAEYWIKLLEENGFEFQKDLTEECRKISSCDKEDYAIWRANKSSESVYRGAASEAHRLLDDNNSRPDFFFQRNGLVFINKMLN
jgi:SAM-dependent methyltransferase